MNISNINLTTLAVFFFVIFLLLLFVLDQGIHVRKIIQLLQQYNFCTCTRIYLFHIYYRSIYLQVISLFI